MCPFLLYSSVRLFSPFPLKGTGEALAALPRAPSSRFPSAGARFSCLFLFS